MYFCKSCTFTVHYSEYILTVVFVITYLVGRNLYLYLNLYLCLHLWASSAKALAVTVTVSTTATVIALE